MSFRLAEAPPAQLWLISVSVPLSLMTLRGVLLAMFEYGQQVRRATQMRVGLCPVALC
jgi:hypothetical protein